MSREAWTRDAAALLPTIAILLLLAWLAPHANIAALEHFIAGLPGHDASRPAWAPPVEAGAWLGAAALCCLLLPRLTPVAGWLGASALAVAVLGLEWALIALGGIWLRFGAPALLLLAAPATLAWWRARPAHGAAAPADLQPSPDMPGAARAAASPAMLTLPDGSRTTADGTLILKAPELPHKLGRYHIARQLGRGAMGAVYLGEDPRIDRRVAIKTLALAREVQPEDLASVRERFFSEAATAGRLNHPGIVQVFDAGEDHSLAWIAMEFVDGHDLARHAAVDRLLPIDRVLRYVADAADALDSAHQRGVIHRDIKPGNLMVTRDDVLKVTDFGVARVADLSRTRTGMILGTPSYMSPEQIGGRRLDARTDIYALGVTMFHLLTGHLPFQAESLATLMHHITHDAAPPPSTLRPGIPPAVDAIVERAMRKNADFRYRSAAELARALRGVSDLRAAQA